MNKYNNHQYVSLSQKAQHALSTDISQRHKIEACGVLLGSIDNFGNWLVEDICPLRNTFNSPVYFEFDPEELLNIELSYPDKVVGVYHSHPTGFAQASDTDRRNMQHVNTEECIPWVWLIVCGPFSQQPPQHKIPGTKILAYHHFDKDGLQKITLQLAEPTSDIKPAESNPEA
jgi:[CysO sulfur-carrier protein]-S-L-cysteine hydrolase